MDVRIQALAFDPGGELNQFSSNVQGAGAVVSFTGIVRDVAGGLHHMEIEHYPGMTEAAITEICEAAMSRWSLSDAMVIHRFGVLEPGATIMMVATASTHRQDAFEAAEFLMDYLKSRAPFWKKEVTKTGASWVEARERDEDALGRWG